MEYRQTIREKALVFSRNVIDFCKTLPKNDTNTILVRQLMRSATSVGANYIEASDPLGKKDFINRLRIARKEAKESIYWLDLIEVSNKTEFSKIHPLKKECDELLRILSSIINKKAEHAL